MKLILSAAVFSVALNASAQQVIQGSDTLAGVMTSAIQAWGFGNDLVYQGGGSSKGEKALLAGEQGFAPMSRAAKASAMSKAKSQGLELIGHKIALDGVGVFAHGTNSVPGLNLDTLAKIFSCQITSWDQVPSSGMSGTIKAYRRDDNSGTTDTFKSLVLKKAGLKKFGSCVTVLEETVDIAEATASEKNAIGYSGATAKRPGNRALEIAKSGSNYVRLDVFTVRNGSYPLARALYVYEIAGSREPNDVERDFLENVMDRSQMDPIVRDNQFYTLD